MTKKSPSSDQDAGLKKLGMAFLWGEGFVVRPEVLISQPMVRAVRSSSTYLDITDVDVLGYKFDSLLALHTICIDCGAGQKRSPIERAMWLRGLKEAVALDKTICVVGRAVEEEHRLAARRFGTLLLSGNEFQEYVDQLKGRTTLVDFQPYYDANQEWLQYIGGIPGAFYDFFKKDNWQREWGRIPVTVPGQLKRWGANMDSARHVHQHGLIELALLLSIGLVRLAVQVYETRPSDFPGVIRATVLGGDKQGKVVDQLLKVILDLERQGSALRGELFQESSRYDVPYMTELLDLIHRLVKRIGKAVYVPRYIQAFQLARLMGRIERYPEFLTSASDPVVVKLALDVFRYLRLASESKDDYRELLKGI